jgi:Questin oxidase-like
MAAEALCTLGFGDEVASWVEDYKRRMTHHDPPEPRFRLDPSDERSWQEALGRFDRAGDWEELFRRELADSPWREVLARWWPRLVPGLMAALTHGLIRTAHAVRCLAATERPDDLALTELARGLAYWAARYTTLPGEVSSGEQALAEAVDRLSRTPTPSRLADLQSNPSYVETLSALRPLPAPRRLSEMTSTFAGVYLAHPEIPPVPMIHGVTAPAAMRIALAHLPDEQQIPSVAAMWRVHVALLLMFTQDAGTERDSLGAASGGGLPSWHDLFGRALENGDEHVIKFTEACYRENALQPDPRFPAAVQAALDRIHFRWSAATR